MAKNSKYPSETEKPLDESSAATGTEDVAPFAFEPEPTQATDVVHRLKAAAVGVGEALASLLHDAVAEVEALRERLPKPPPPALRRCRDCGKVTDGSKEGNDPACEHRWVSP